MEEVKKTSKEKGGYIAAILLLLGGVAFLTYLYTSKGKELEQCRKENAILTADMNGMNQMLSGYLGDMTNDLKTDFANMLETYDALLQEDKINKDSLEAQKQRIMELQEEVKKGKLTAYQLFKARKEIETMKRIMRGYIVQIDSLNTLNKKLTYNLEETEGKLQLTSQERDQYKKEAEEKGELVKKGSKLQAYNFNSGGLKQKLNGSMVETNRARNTVQIRSLFTISANPITTPGKKKVYMQIIAPSGKTLQHSSGNIIETEKGSVPFSDYKEIDYQNQRIDVGIYYRLAGAKAEKGNYKVNIYCQGHLIGTDNFTLK